MGYNVNRKPAPKFEVGDTVAFTPEFCRSSGQLTGPVPFARGTVVAVRTLKHGFTIVTVEWGFHWTARYEGYDPASIPSKVGARTLERVK